MARLTCFLALAFVIVFVGSSSAQLTTNFYEKSCPHLFPVVRDVVQSAIRKEARMGASLLRLHFHDCFVNGCDGSNLLDDTSSFKGEKSASPNFQSARGFEVIDQIKAAVERVCPGVVSCADILAVTARDSVVGLGGPTWDVKLGRRDARTANQAAANSSIPPASSSLSRLISSFQNQGLTIKDLVALYGGHSIGQARCTNFRAHIYNDSDINASFAKSLKANCPPKNGTGDNNLAPLDPQTPNKFDHIYFQGLVNKKAPLHSDQELTNGASTSSWIQKYSTNPSLFSSDFGTSMIKMGDIKPLTGSNGEIRKNCRRIN
uniref:Peroxidase n=1 Tax=Sesuvium portulacastrum TaxID=221166 RepID=C0KXH4_SESPO|nr:peroxidase 1 [Sesuvium portulacastrum]